MHKRRYAEARDEYVKDAKKPETFVMTEDGEATAYYSADLQKVILLPRMDQFKKAIFTKGFAGVATGYPNFAVLWHEGISGRNDEDLASVFHRFLLETERILCFGWTTAPGRIKTGKCFPCW